MAPNRRDYYYHQSVRDDDTKKDGQISTNEVRCPWKYFIFPRYLFFNLFRIKYYLLVDFNVIVVQKFEYLKLLPNGKNWIMNMPSLLLRRIQF